MEASKKTAHKKSTKPSNQYEKTSSKSKVKSTSREPRKTALAVGKSASTQVPFLSSSKGRFVLVSLLLIALVTWAVLNKSLFIVATVDGKPITRLTLIRELEKVGGKQVLEDLILNKAIEMEAKKKNVSVTESELNEEIKKTEQDLKSQGTSLDQVLSFQGLDRESFKERLRLRKLILKLMGDRIKVSDKEVSDYIEKNKEALPKDMGDEELSKYVRNLLEQQKSSEEMNAFLQELRSKFKVNNYYNNN